MIFTTLVASQQKATTYFNSNTNNFFKNLTDTFKDFISPEVANKMIECWKIQLTTNAWILDTECIKAMQKEYSELINSFLEIIKANKHNFLENNLRTELVEDIFNENLLMDVRTERLKNLLQLLAINDKFEQLDNHVQSLLLSTRFFYSLEHKFLDDKLEKFLASFIEEIDQNECHTIAHHLILGKLNNILDYYTIAYTFSVENDNLLHTLNSYIEPSKIIQILKLNKERIDYFNKNITEIKEKINDEIILENEDEDIYKEIRDPLITDNLIIENGFSDLLGKISNHSNCCIKNRIHLNKKLLDHLQTKLEVFEQEIFGLNNDYEKQCGYLNFNVTINCMQDINKENQNLYKAILEFVDQQFIKFEINNKIYIQRLSQFENISMVSKLLYTYNDLYQASLSTFNKVKNKNKSNKKKKKQKNKQIEQQDSPQIKETFDQLPKLAIYSKINSITEHSLPNIALKNLEKLITNSLDYSANILHSAEHIIDYSINPYGYIKEHNDKVNNFYTLMEKDIKQLAFTIYDSMSIVTPIMVCLDNRFKNMLKIVNNLSCNVKCVANTNQLQNLINIFYSELFPEYKSMINLYNKHSFLSIKYKKICSSFEDLKVKNIEYIYDVYKLFNNTQFLTQSECYIISKTLLRDIGEQCQILRLSKCSQSKKDTLLFSDLVKQGMYDIFFDRYKSGYRKEIDNLFQKMEENKKISCRILSCYDKSNFSNIKIILKSLLFNFKLNNLESQLNILNTQLFLDANEIKPQEDIEQISNSENNEHLSISSNESSNNNVIIMSKEEYNNSKLCGTLKIVNLEEIIEQQNLYEQYDPLEISISIVSNKNINNNSNENIENELSINSNQIKFQTNESVNSLSTTRESILNNNKSLKNINKETNEKECIIQNNIEKDILTNKMNQLQSENSNLKNKNKNLQKKFNLQMQETSNLISSLNLKNEKQINNLNNTINQYKNETLSLKDQLTEHVNKIQQLETEKQIDFNKHNIVVSLKKENEKLLKENHNLNKNIISLQETVSEVSQKNKQYQKENESLLKEISTHNNELNNLKQEKKSYLNSKSNMQNTINENIEQINHCNQLIKNLKQEKNESFKRNDVLNGKITKLKEENILQDKKIKELTQNMNHLNSEFLSQSRTNSELQEKISILETNNQNQKKKIQEINNFHKTQLDENLIVFSKKIEELQIIIEQQKVENLELTNKNSGLLDSLIKLQQENSSLKNQYNYECEQKFQNFDFEETNNDHLINKLELENMQLRNYIEKQKKELELLTLATCLDSDEQKNYKSISNIWKDQN